MARKRIDPNGMHAQELLAWLESLGLESRVINPLRRELEVVQGKREGVPGKSGVLAGVDRARFVAELYSNGGGVIRRVPAVGTNAIDALRAVIPAPASTDTAPVYGDDFELPPLDDELPAPAAEAGPEVSPPVAAEEPAAPAAAKAPKRRGRLSRGEATPESAPNAPAPPMAAEEPAAPAKRRRRHQQGEATLTPEATAPAASEASRRRGRSRRGEAVPATGAPSEATPEAPKRRGRRRAVEAAAEAVVEAAPAAETSPEATSVTEAAAPAASEAPRRRGRPRRGEAAPAAAEAPSEAASEAPRRRGRRLRDRTAGDDTQRAGLRAPALAEAAPLASAPAPPAPPPDPSFAVLLRLWQELHPQGQRAAMHYMASLVGEE